MTTWIGTSGWQYDHWRATFYPPELAKRAWLEHYAACFDTVEINNAFYRLPERHIFEDWAARTPAGFLFAVKASRYLTHIKRLRQPQEPVARLMGRLEGLGEKQGPVLLQLPPTLPFDRDALVETLAAFPRGTRVVLEARHDSWFVDAVRRVLEEREVAWCLTDTAGRRAPLWRTAPWGYVRFHEGRASPRPCFGRTALASWAGRLAELFEPECDVFAYFNNDPRGCAVRDAGVFSAAVVRTGRTVTATPAPASVRLRYD